MEVEGQVPTRSTLPAETSLGPVTLGVADADRAVAFYRDFLGLEVLRAEPARVVLGAAGTALMVLEADPALRPPSRGTTGLYHVAILLPTRADLAQILKRLVDTGHRFGASDHLVSEALYLSDPDRNGLEIYRDRPKAEWRRRGSQIEMDTLQLDGAGIMRELREVQEPWRMPAGTRIGHIHLKVADLGEAEAFYHGVLGFDITTTYPGALFLSAGGYHHHIGANTWESAGGSPPPPGSTGLRSFTINLPDAAALGEVQSRLAAAGVPVRDREGAVAVEDPVRNTVLLAVGASDAAARTS
jgi:catechol 2,3-dioxygenase